MDKHVEVLIIGSGAGGGTHRCLAEASREVMVLERGDWLPREPQNWEPEAVFQQGRYVLHRSLERQTRQDVPAGSHYFVGGASKMYGAAHFRFRERDFEEMVHVDGLSPAWPVRYGDFEPYYTKAEAMYHVHGLRGEDPTEPPASGPYPHPPVAHEPACSSWWMCSARPACILSHAGGGEPRGKRFAPERVREVQPL